MLYVDYMLVENKGMIEINRLKGQLDRTFEMKNIGAEKKNLGLRDT